jgi:plastocyanin
VTAAGVEDNVGPELTVDEPPPDGEWRTQVTFSEPGIYRLRCRAHEGGLMAYSDVTITVIP